MNRFFSSPALTLAISYVAFGIIALVLFAAPLWYAWQVTVQENRAEILKEDADRLSEVFRREGEEGLKNFIVERIGLQIPGERILLLGDANFHPVTGNIPTWPAGVPSQSGTYTATIDLNGHATPVLLVRADLPGDYHLLVGRDLARFSPLEERFWYGLAAAVAVLTMVGIIGAVMIRGALLRRIHSIGATASAIMQGDLSRRLPVPASNDEIAALSRTINRMLEQTQQLIDGIRNVSNAIAHDLRTPLTELRSRLEELAVTKPSPSETFTEIDEAVTDVDRVIRIFNALLRLAEIDTGMRRAGFVPVNAAGIVADAVEFYLPAAELKGISLTSTDAGPVPLSGDPLLLAQAVGNLIDNALKYGPAKGFIHVAARVGRDGNVEISVSDDGPGIPEAEKPKATERFYRGDASRGTPGIGLGLSLASAVAKLHGGMLELTDNHPGLCASIIIERG